jgi:hypothetical protein
MWYLRLKYHLLRSGGDYPLSSLHPGPDVAGAWDGFPWCRYLDLPCLIAKLPLVGGDAEGLHCNLR